MGRIHLSKFDLWMHSNPQRKYTPGLSAQAYRSMKEEMTCVQQPHLGNPAATFGHLMRNYDSTFYAYLYSQVFSIDVYQEFCNSNSILQQSEFSSSYREAVLERGGTRNGMDMLYDLLRRSPDIQPFISFIDSNVAPNSS